MVKEENTIIKKTLINELLEKQERGRVVVGKEDIYYGLTCALRAQDRQPVIKMACQMIQIYTACMQIGK